MEHVDVSNQSLAAQEAEIYRFVIRTTDLKDPVSCSTISLFWIILFAIDRSGFDDKKMMWKTIIIIEQTD